MKFLLKRLLPALPVGMILAALCAACVSQSPATGQSASTDQASPTGRAPTASQPASTNQAPSTGFGFEVQGKEWKLAGVEVGGTDTGFSRARLGTDFSNAYTLRFQDGLATGRGAPNSYRAPFEQGPNQGLSLQQAAATLMAPLREPEGLKEHEYFRYLARVYHWDINGGQLRLLTKTEDGKEAILIYLE
jgi:hypothetical protein